MRDPKTRDYQIWVDLYDLVGCEAISDDEDIWAVVTIGTYSSVRHHAVWYKKKKFYRWKENQVPKMEEIQLPHDFS